MLAVISACVTLFTPLIYMSHMGGGGGDITSQVEQVSHAENHIKDWMNT